MATYYVATAGGGGSDSNPGTIGAPWLTAQKAANTAVAGDTCYFRTGSYAAFTAVNDGSAGNPITFKNYNSEIVYLDAQLGTVVGTNVQTDVINLSSRSYITIDGLRITGNTIQSGTHTGRAHVNVEMGTSHHITLQNCQVSFGWGTGVGIYWESHDITVQNCRIFENAKDNYARPAGNDWGAGMIAFHGCYNILFKNNLIYWNHGEGVTAGDHSHEVTFDGNLVCDNWSVNLYAADGCQNVTVKNNVIFNTDTAINYSASINNNPDLIVLTVGDSASSYLPSQLLLTGIRIYNNILIGHGSWGITRFVTSAGYADSDWVIANNTFLMTDSPGFRHGGDISISNLQFQNNLFTGSLSGANSTWAFVNFAVSPTSVTLSNNLYHTSTSNEWILQGNSQTTLANWVSASGETNSLTSAPLLGSEIVSLPVIRDGDDSAAIDLSNIHLTMGSPASNAGADLSAFFTDDYDGNTRTLPFDIGAFEFLPFSPPVNRRLIASDSFAGSTLTALGGNWQQLSNAFITMYRNTSGQLTSSPNMSDLGAARWTAAAFANDQYSSVEFVSLPAAANSAIGVVARASGDINALRDFYYFIVARDPTVTTQLFCFFGKVVNGTFTEFAERGDIAWVAGDRIELECEGTTIRAMRSGIPVLSVTDSDMGFGTPGVAGIGDFDGIGDNWEGGNLNDVTGSIPAQKGRRFMFLRLRG